jgi:hypothetical protein
MRRYITLGFILLWVTIAIHAQEGRTAPDTLRYGDIVEGEISDRRFEVFYNFEGDANNVLVLEVVSLTDDFDWPEVVLFSNENEILADSNEFVSVNRSTIAAILPYSGTYQIMVGRDDGRFGDGEGEYQVRVLQPATLTPGVTIPGVAQKAADLNFYAVRQPEVFSVYYEVAGGELNPELKAYRVDTESGQLRLAATITGNEVVNVAIGLDGATSDLHMITVGDSIYATAYNNRIETADYRLRLQARP